MASASRIRVMVVDDHPIMRNGLRDVLEASGRFEVVGQAEDGDEAVKTVEGLQPQVIVMDVIMPNKDGIDACREIMELLPDTRVLMLTASSEMDAVIEAGRRRGDGVSSEVLTTGGTGGGHSGCG